MGNYLSAGLYLERRSSGSRPIAGVSTATLGIIGQALKGPEVATIVTSFPEYERMFGGLDVNSENGYAVKGFFDNGGRRCAVVRVIGSGGAAATAAVDTNKWDVNAVSKGTWANGLKVDLADNPDIADTDIMDITVKDSSDNVLEFFEAVSLDTTNDANLPTYITNVINGVSEYIEFVIGVGGGNGPTAEEVTLAAGSNGTALVDADITAKLTQGSSPYDSIRENLLFIAPDFVNDVVIGALIDYADARKDAFVPFGAPLNTATAANAVTFLRTTLNKNSTRGAYYWPFVQIYDTVRRAKRIMTPAGHIAGVYARTDSDRNVGKAPAGITDGAIRGITGIARSAVNFEPIVPGDGTADTLYPARVNPLVSDPSTGMAVWGARTISLDPEWRYIQASRLFMFVEKSVYNALFWVVFENNGPALWVKSRAQINGFLGNLFADGYFAGTTPEEAYFVIADSSNNPQTAVDAGLFTIDVGLAANKPAEFVRLRFQQKVLTS